MPKLLDYTALGPRETGRTGRPSATADLSADKTAIAGIGNSLSRVGDMVGSFADKQQADDTRIATSNATANLLKEQNAFEQRMREEPDNWQNHEKEYEEHIARARQNSAALISDPRQRKLWEAQNQTVMEGWRQRVQSTVRSRHNDAFLSQTQTDVNEIRNLALDPNTPEEERALHIQAAGDMIEDARRRGVINDQQAGEWAKRWREGYAVTKLEMMPARERAVSLAGVRHATPQLGSAIAASAQRLGIDPVDLGTVISYETGGTFDPWKAGPTTQWGQHRGLIQWGEPQRKKYGVYEGMPVEEQLKAVEAYLKDAGVKPGMGLLDVYSAINAGRVGRYNASDAGNGGAPGTVADKVNNQMAGHRRKAAALLGGKSVDPIAEMVPPETRQRMYDRAIQEDERERRQEGLTVQQLMRDDEASLLATGIGAKSLNYDRVAGALGKEQADLWEQRRVTAFETHQNTRGMDEMTDEQLRVHAQKFIPTETDAGEGFTGKLQIYQNVEKRAQEILKQRAEDPAAAVENSAAVRAARQSLEGDNSVGAREAFIFTRMQQQELLGVPKSLQSPITVAEARNYAAKMRPLARGQADVADQNGVIQGIVQEIEQTYGKYAPDVLKRVLYQVTLKRDAAEVLAGAITRMQKADAGPLVTTEENRRLQQGEQARSIQDMSGFDPFDGKGGPYGAMPEPVYPMPTANAQKLLLSDPQKYLPAFIQKYGAQAVPRNLRFGPHIDEMTVPQPQGKR